MQLWYQQKTTYGLPFSNFWWLFTAKIDSSWPQWKKRIGPNKATFKIPSGSKMYGIRKFKFLSSFFLQSLIIWASHFVWQVPTHALIDFQIKANVDNKQFRPYNIKTTYYSSLSYKNYHSAYYFLEKWSSIYTLLCRLCLFFFQFLV